MRVGILVSAVSVCVLCFTDVRATESRGRWLNLDVGFSGGAGAIARNGGQAGIHLAIGASRPLVRNLRTLVELQGDIFAAGSGWGGSQIPEVSGQGSPSRAASVLAGFEAYGPVRGQSAPFLSASVGAAYTTVGDAREFDTSSGAQVTTLFRGKSELRPAVGLKIGFRRLPDRTGTNPRLTLGYVLVSSAPEASHIFSASLGLGF